MTSPAQTSSAAGFAKQATLHNACPDHEQTHDLQGPGEDTAQQDMPVAAVASTQAQGKAAAAASDEALATSAEQTAMEALHATSAACESGAPMLLQLDHCSTPSQTDAWHLTQIV